MSDADARKWPPHLHVEFKDTWNREFGFWSSRAEIELSVGKHAFDTYIHRDAARAWAGLWAWLSFGVVERPMCGGCEFRDLSTEIRCQAWQEFRDFLDGTPEQWQQTAYNAYIEGRDDTRRGLWDSSSEVRDE